MSRIAIVGPGAIGSVIAAHLFRTGEHELLLCARRPVGELVVSIIDEDVRFTPTFATSPTAPQEPVEWVLVTTKAYDSASAAAWLPALCSPSTRVAILQNGVEHRERFAGTVPADRLVPVMVDLPAERSASRVMQRGSGRLVVQDDANGRAFLRLFERTNLSATVTPDLTSVLWRKLCVNAAGVVSALVDEPAGVMRRDEAVQLAKQIVREVIAVGRAEGADLADTLADSVVAGYQAAPVDGMNSLHADRRAGRPSEIDARNGIIVRKGQAHGIPTPYNQMAVWLIRLMETRQG
jgi:2-dehydropantoate 2-reductase